MALKYQKWDKIAELIFENPGRRFTVREISKRTRIPASSAQRYLKEIRSEGLATQENMAVSSPYFKFKKSFFAIDKLFKTGLIEYLDKMFNPSAVIVFGSIRKGDYDAESDIDLFIESTKRPKTNLPNFEKKLGHKVQLFIEKDINDLPPELLNSVLNGIKLRGYFKIK